MKPTTFSYLKPTLTFLLLISQLCTVESSLKDYINGISTYFGYTTGPSMQETTENEITHRIPYEVSTLDEKFISEAVKLTGVTISELDSCQQRVSHIHSIMQYSITTSR